MSERILDIDHLMVSVRDSQVAGETFERMGFTLTPRSGLPGMSNRLICFDPPSTDRCNFIEFLGIDDRALAPPMMYDILGDTERPVSMVMVAGDARAVDADLTAKGFEPFPVMELKRDWTLPSGEVISPEFIVSIPKPGRSPLFWNAVQYVTPQHYRRPEFTKHPNPAVGFSAVLAIAPDPATVGRHYETAWDAKTTTDANGSVDVMPGHVPLRILTPDFAADRFDGVAERLAVSANDAAYLGFVVRVTDMATLRRHLDDAGVTPRDLPSGRIWIGPEAAHGCVVVFEADG